MMHTGDVSELRDRERRAHAIAEQIARLLNDLDALAPGSVGMTGGRLQGLGVTVRNIGGAWEAVQ